MAKRTLRLVGLIGTVLIFTFSGALVGCQDQPPAPTQSSSPATVVPQAQAPAPVVPQAQAPAPVMPQAQMPSTPLATPAAPGGAPQNIGQIQVGMSSQQVMQIMGNPGKIKQEGQMVEWKYYTQSGKYEVKFMNDRVTGIEIE